MFYTKEEVSRLKLSEATEALKLLTKQYNLEKPIFECWEAVWEDLDQICETLLYLEDHIKQLGDPRYAIQNEGLVDEVDPDIDELIEI